MFNEKYPKQKQIDGLVQEKRNSIANALELCLSCTNPSKYCAYLNSTKPGCST